MDGEAWDGQERAREVEQAGFRRERVLAAKHDLTGQRQRTIEPTGEDQPAVGLDVQQAVAVSCKSRRGFDTEAWEVGMSRRDAESALLLRTDGEGEKSGAESLRVIPSAGRQKPRLAPDERRKAGLGQQHFSCPRGMVRRRRLRDESQKFLDHDEPP